ncbi:hypothetical protein Pav037_4199 [Pseudomonas syringae pv. avellanae str. ISPaVe037]|nr:hypothetical protein Pav037_4199 [Pseudomonas syringae pv. avellanae str. ISPaVe037]
MGALNMSVMTVTDSSFPKEVVEASHHRLVVVEFSTKGKVNKQGAENASARMDTIFDGLEADYADKVTLVRAEIELDADLKDSLNPLMTTEYAINHGPTLVFLKQGKRVREDLVGQQTKEQMVKELDELLISLPPSKFEFSAFVEKRIKQAALTLADGKISARDDVALGQLIVFLTLRRALLSKGVALDLGILDGINDSLQLLQLLQPRETFLGRLEP